MNAKVWLCKIKMSEVDKSLLNFLNGLVRRQYFGEDKFSNDALKEQIFSDMPGEGKLLI